MNKRGNPETLVAAKPGNLNAVRHGAHSPRLIQARAAEIAAELTHSFDFSPTQRLALHEAARCMAILEAIDRDLDERGLEDSGDGPATSSTTAGASRASSITGWRRSRMRSSGSRLRANRSRLPTWPTTCASSNGSHSVATQARARATG